MRFLGLTQQNKIYEHYLFPQTFYFLKAKMLQKQMCCKLEYFKPGSNWLKSQWMYSSKYKKLFANVLSFYSLVLSSTLIERLHTGWNITSCQRLLQRKGMRRLFFFVEWPDLKFGCSLITHCFFHKELIFQKPRKPRQNDKKLQSLFKTLRS